MKGESEMNRTELCELAVKAKDNAYTPYSGFKVGAALMCRSGRVFTGCNIENASYTPTVCAERTAVFKAVSEGETEFEMLAVCGGRDGIISGMFPPCGVCRQVLAEFCPPEFPIIIITSENTFKELTLEELLPFSFNPEYMNTED